MDKTENVNGKIMDELYQALDYLGADSSLLCVVGSLCDKTMTDEQCLADLRMWNQSAK